MTDRQRFEAIADQVVALANDLGLDYYRVMGVKMALDDLQGALGLAEPSDRMSAQFRSWVRDMEEGELP